MFPLKKSLSNTRRLLLLALVYYLLVMSKLSVSQTRIPLIYYFDQDNSSFVVEQADGSNHTILVQYRLPDSSVDHVIDGPGWSPSGSMFAWTIAPSDFGGLASSSSALIFDRDTEKLINIGNAETGGTSFQMQWSPSADMLLVEEASQSQNEISHSIYIFDPITETRRFQIDAEAEHVEWSADGTFISIFGLQGEPADQFLILDSNSGSTMNYAYRVDRLCNQFPFWSPLNYLLYPLQDQIRMIRPDTNDTLDFAFEDQVIYFVDWQPDGYTALIYAASSCDAEMLDLHLLSVADGTISHLLNNVQIPFDFQQARFSGQSEVLGFPQTVWSPMGKYTVVIQAQGTVYAIDPSDLSARQVHNFTSSEVKYLRWISEETIVVLDGKSIVALDIIDNERSVIVDDIGTLIDGYGLQSGPFVSSDGRYVAAVGMLGYVIDTHDSLGANIVDLSAELGYGPSAFYYIWHPSQSWAFVTSLPYPTANVSILDAVAGKQKPLTECRISRSCFGWMPE